MAEVRLIGIGPVWGGHEWPIVKDVTTIGRRASNDIVVNVDGVSRDHAEIVRDGEHHVLRDRGSKFGTFVNSERITECELRPGGIIRLGDVGAPEVRFETSSQPASTDRGTTIVNDIQVVATLLENLRKLESGGVLDEVLALVIDSAIEVCGAERGFIMLADAAGSLDFKLVRGSGRKTLPGSTFATSRKIPEEVFATGVPQLNVNLTDEEVALDHRDTIEFKIRQVSCLPLRLHRFVERADVLREQKRIGVLYLDSHEKGSVVPSSGRTALETLADRAAIAIENARLYRESEAKARLEQELRIAAAIQKGLLPPPRWTGGWFDLIGSSVPCRAIGGDFFDYFELPDGDCAFVVADVSGKGTPAALLTAVIQGVLASHAAVGDGPARAIARVNNVLIRRAIESRFATMVCGTLSRNGRLTFTNAGHNPPFLIQQSGVRRLETGGTIVGLFNQTQYDEETVQLDPGDLVVVFSDGLSEAASPAGEEFGDDRILRCVRKNQAGTVDQLLACLLASVHEFCAGADQSDDVTVLIIRYTG
jgi:sigma-B regulation protein RsbU (phosphoserine phosphatase)